MIDNLFNSLNDRLKGDLYSLFDYASLITERIEELIRENPERANVLWDSFKLVDPFSSPVGSYTALHIPHAEELFQRLIKDGEYANLDKPTKAEILASIMLTSLAAPMRLEFVMLASSLWNEIDFPDPKFNDLKEQLSERTFNSAYDRKYYEAVVVDELEEKIDRHQLDLERYDSVLPQYKLLRDLP